MSGIYIFLIIIKLSFKYISTFMHVEKFHLNYALQWYLYKAAGRSKHVFFILFRVVMKMYESARKLLEILQFLLKI